MTYECFITCSDLLGLRVDFPRPIHLILRYRGIDNKVNHNDLPPDT